MRAIPDARFGSAEAEDADWRAAPDADADDELLPETPADVILMLGFDPLEVESV